jgi:hypothetical protein
MASGLEYPSSPPVIPMFPNGTPGSFKNSVPIQRVADGLSDGMSEGFARVRRGVNRVRSPRLAADNGMVAGVPLEFAEEDEDFILNDGASNSREDGGSVSVSTPSSGPGDAGEHKDDENTWPSWDVAPKVDDDWGSNFKRFRWSGLWTKSRRRRSVGAGHLHAELLDSELIAGWVWTRKTLGHLQILYDTLWSRNRQSHCRVCQCRECRRE